MGKLRPYMIFSLTDETYSVFCSFAGEESDGVMLRVAAYDHLYWITGSVAGALLAQGLPFDLTGIDFAMTALFIVICVERVMNKADRLPAAIGGVCAAGCLLLLCPERFLAPALLLCAAILLAMTRMEREEKEAAK